MTEVSNSKDCLSRSQVYLTEVSKSKDCLSRSQVYVTGVNKSKDCSSRSEVYICPKLVTAKIACLSARFMCLS